MPQSYVFTIFLQTFLHDYQPLKIAAKIFFITMKINLNIQNLKIIPYNQKKMQIQYGALFLQFSIFIEFCQKLIRSYTLDTICEPNIIIPAQAVCQIFC